MTLVFWTSFFIVFYTFFGYGILLYLLVKVRTLIVGKRKLPDNAGIWPTLTVIVAAYNEEDTIIEKINNTLQLNYPEDKLQFIFVTDGSDDRTRELVAGFSQIKLMHEPGRNGKTAAIHRAMQAVNTEITIFAAANTLLNKDALVNMCRHYKDLSVGAVSGGKRVNTTNEEDATAAMDFYRRYESKLKVLDSELYSIVGAAGELFSIRTRLYEPIPPDAIPDDFMIPMLTAGKGFRIVYEPMAYVTKNGFESVPEELERKIRIAAGGIQSTVYLKSLFNPFSNFVLFFQYISRRVLLWTVPYLIILVLITNCLLVCHPSIPVIYWVLLMAQLCFYVLAFFGWMLEKRQVRVNVFFIPYYFCMMNYAVMVGISRYWSGSQSAVLDKAKGPEDTSS